MEYTAACSQNALRVPKYQVRENGDTIIGASLHELKDTKEQKGGQLQISTGRINCIGQFEQTFGLLGRCGNTLLIGNRQRPNYPFESSESQILYKDDLSYAT